MADENEMSDAVRKVIIDLIDIADGKPLTKVPDHWIGLMGFKNPMDTNDLVKKIVDTGMVSANTTKNMEVMKACAVMIANHIADLVSLVYADDTKKCAESAAEGVAAIANDMANIIAVRFGGDVSGKTRIMKGGRKLS